MIDTRGRRRLVGLLAAPLAVVLVMTACGGAPAAPTSAPAPTAMPTAGTGATSAKQVDVKESEFKIDMPTTLPAGPTVFKVTNAGAIGHSFEIQGQGIDMKLDSTLQPGGTGMLQVDLKPGTYQVFCPVDGHKDQGMLVTLTVQ